MRRTIVHARIMALLLCLGLLNMHVACARIDGLKNYMAVVRSQLLYQVGLTHLRENSCPILMAQAEICDCSVNPTINC